MLVRELATVSGRLMLCVGFVFGARLSLGSPVFTSSAAQGGLRLVTFLSQCTLTPGHRDTTHIAVGLGVCVGCAVVSWI